MSDRKAPADVFYIISTEIGDYTFEGTSYHHAYTYNDSLRAPLYGEMLGVDTLVSGKLNYYSPYYRQCSLQSFTSDSLIEARYPVALDDVRNAFDYYLKHYNNGRPFVLAGFSQGARLVLDLMEEMPDDVFKRMIAAYAIGTTITDDMLQSNPHIVPAKSAEDTGVTICYNSVKSAADALSDTPSALVINPVNWMTDSTKVQLITEPSPLKPVDQQKKDTMMVKVDTENKLVLVEGCTADDYMLPIIGKEGCYHTREIWFYRQQLRDNIQLRADRFLAHP